LKPEFHEDYLNEAAKKLIQTNNPLSTKLLRANLEKANLSQSERPYFTTTFVPGVSLHTLIKSGVQLDDIAKAKLCTAIAYSVKFIHDEGLAHRAIIPENIMIDINGYPHLNGACFSSSRDVTVNNRGNVNYAAPETEIDGSLTKSNAKTDIYALGGIIFFIITGKEPYEEFKNANEILLDNIKKNRLDPNFMDQQKYYQLSNGDEKYREIIEKCWIFGPESRITINELCEKLDIAAEQVLSKDKTKKYSAYCSKFKSIKGSRDIDIDEIIEKDYSEKDIPLDISFEYEESQLPNVANALYNGFDKTGINDEMEKVLKKIREFIKDKFDCDVGVAEKTVYENIKEILEN
jgi:serine/threonine protein kinase